LVEELIRATSPRIDAIRFLGGPSSQLRGFDGILDAEGAPPYVPEGLSVWEFGAGSGSMVEKATEDLEKRSKNPRGVEPADTTFVFVTPRNWDPPKLSREEWIKKVPNAKAWKDILVFDSVILDGWLDQRPAVASRFAKHLGLRPIGGVWTVDEFWEEFSANFDFTIQEDVLLCEREQLTGDLLEQLANGAQAVKIRGDSEDEVAAFVAAAIRKADPDVSAYLRDRTLIVDTEDAAMQLQDRNVVSVVLRRQAVQRGPQLQQRHPTIIPFGADQLIKDVKALDRPSARGFQSALEASGKSATEAGQIAYRCGRSITILARTNPAGVPKRPKWAASGRELIPALLACGWDGAKPGDREIIQKLAQEDYAAYERRIVHWPSSEDPPLEKAGTVWKLLAPADALAQLGAHITDADFDTLAEIAKDVFSERSPDLDRPPDEFISRAGKRRHSDWLRRGVVTSLLQLSYFSKRLKLGTSRDAETIVTDQFRDLPALTENYDLIASIGGDLQYLAEAAPESFLTALERLLEGDKEASRLFFAERGQLSPVSYHTGVLWALDVLAWSPDLLGRVSELLASYAEIDPGGRLMNRPINSLRGIYLPWRPATNATLARRMEVLDGLRARRPDVAWRLIESLLPRTHDSASDTSRPRFEEFGASERERVTRGLVALATHNVVERAVADAGHQPERWKPIIEHLHAMEPQSLEYCLVRLSELEGELEGEQRTAIWSILRDQINRHRKYKDARWALHPTIVERLNAIALALTPSDTKQQIAWLFDDQFPDVEGRGRAAIEIADAARTDAIKSLLAERGMDGVKSLAKSAKLPHLVGRALFAAAPESGDDLDVFASWHESDALRAMAVGYSLLRQHRDERTWTQSVMKLAETGKISTDALVEHALAWQDSLALWQDLQQTNPEAAKTYWQKTHWPLARTPEEAEYATDALLAVDRGVTALAMMHQQLKHLSTQRIVTAIRGALEQIVSDSNASEQLTDHFLQESFAELRGRSDVDEDEIASLEWQCLPLLDYGQTSGLFLHQRMARDAAFFFSALQLIYRPKDDETPLSKQDEARASQAYRMLMHFETVPGAKGDSLDYIELRAWIDALRQLGVEHDYTEITEAYIGHILAHAAADPDDCAWPHQSVRRVIDELASSEIERGVQIERFNMRGVVTKAMGEGGRQERDLADNYRKWAATASATPRSARLLSAMAKQWDEEAKQADEQAAKDKLRFSS